MLLWVQDQLGLHSKALSKNIKNQDPSLFPGLHIMPSAPVAGDLLTA